MYKTKEKYFIECLESLPSDANIEIILVFDGEQPQLEDISKEFKEKNENINIYKIVHSGVSSARNHGLKKSRGTYVTFVDSDDFLDSNFESEIHNSLIVDDYRSDVYLYNIYRYKDDTKEILENNFVTKNIICENEKLIVDLKKQLIHKSFSVFKPRYNTIAVVVGKIYKRKFLVENDIKFNLHLKYSEDAIFFYEILNLRPRIYIIEANLYYYRISTFQTTTKYVNNLEIEYLSAIKAYEKLILQEENPNQFFEILPYRKLINIFSLLRNETLNISSYNAILNIRKRFKYFKNNKDYQDVMRLQISSIYKNTSLYYSLVMFLNKLKLYGIAALVVLFKIKL